MSKQRLGQAFVSTVSTRDTSSRSAADCIGRVGALAAALGVGAMLLATPWTAAAQTDGSSGASESSSSETSSADSESVGNDSDDTGQHNSGASDDDDDAETDEPDSELSDELDSALNDLDSELSDDLDSELGAELGDDLDSELGDDLDSELDSELDADDDEGASTSGDDGVEVVPADDDITAEVAEELSSDSNVSSDPVDSAVPTVVAEEPVIQAQSPDPLPAGSAPVDEAEPPVAESGPSRSSSSLALSTARTTAPASEPTEAPAKALQAQPGTFLEVASSMLSAVIAPFVTSPTAPAAPSAQPLMWGVLSWVRRELEDTFANFSISIGGHQLVQNGTAYATSEGFGSLAIAHGENAIASASGLFTAAVVTGDDSTATSEGNFTHVRVRGADNSASATGAGNRTTVWGEMNTATNTGRNTTVYLRGDGNEAATTGTGNRATVYGEGNEVVLAGQDGSAQARVVGDRNTVTAASEDGRTRVSVVGDDNDATTLATAGSRAEITVRGDGNSAAASADEDSTARASIIGDTGTAVATANLDGYAAARITGDSNVASSDALGHTSIARITGNESAASATAAEARAEAATFGDGNAAQATDGKAVIAGDGSSATAEGPRSLARVWGDNSTASALGERNTAFVWGNDSRAVAGPGIFNNALVFGSNLLADTGPGDGRTVYGQPFDPENQAPVAGTPGEQTVDPETGSVTGTLGFTDPDGDTLTYTVYADPANGTVTFNATAGTYTYTPTTRPPFGQPDGTDTFTVTASDGQASAMTTITVPVTALPDPGNQAPVAGTPGEQTVDPETGSVTGTLGFTDPDGDTLTYTVYADPANGTVTFNATAGTYTYTPTARPPFGQPDGTDTFTVTASDGQASAMTTITVPVTALPEPDNQAPVAVADSYTVDQDSTLVVTGPGVLGNDTDPDSDALTAALASAPANGTLTLNPNGSFTYTPDAGYTGTDSFTYTATDGDLVSATATVTVTVTPVGTTPPNTVIGTAGVGENPTGVSVTPDGSRVYVVNAGNLFNEDNASVTVIDVSNPADPTVLQTIPFEIYNPQAIAISPDGLRAYVSYDNVVGGNGSLLVIDTDPTSATYNTIIGDPIEVGDGPDDIEFTPDGSRAIILNQSSLDIVVLDTDPTSPTFHTVIGSPIRVSNSSPSALALTPDGLRAYITIPRSGANSVHVIDIDPASAGYGTVISGAIPVGDNPADIAITPDGTRAYVVNTFDDTLTVIDTDPTSATYNTVIGNPIALGDLPREISFLPDGTRAYVSVSAENRVLIIDTDPGSATFNTVIDDVTVGDLPRELAISTDGEHLYVINDRDETVSVVYLGSSSGSENRAPVANSDAYSLDEDATLNVVGPGVLGNDTDADSDPLTAVLAAGPANGTFVLNPDGSFSYTPNSGYTGTDTFTYTADDGEDTSAITTVTLTVNPVDDPADLGDDSATVVEGSTGNVINVLANDTDPDGALTVTAVGAAGNGTTSITGDSLSVVYTPDPNYIGEDTFTYTVTDPEGGTATATVTVTVIAAANQPPVAGPPGEQSIVLETGRVTGTLGITDPEGAFLDYTVDSGPSLGSVEIDFLGNYTYTPDPENRPAFGEDDGSDTFIVTATDPAGASAQTTITVPVVAELNAENQAPVAGIPGPLSVDTETGEVSGSLDFITDPDGDELDFLTIPGGFDAIEVLSDGTFTYIPNTASRLRGDTTQTMTVIATDPAGLSATVDIEIPIIAAQANVVATVEDVGAFLTNVAVSPTGSVVYVSDSGVPPGDSVSVIDPVTRMVIDSITVGANPDGITFDADGSTAYVVSADDGTLVVIDAASATVVETIDLDHNNPREVAISPDGLRAYVVADDAATSSGVVMIDLDPSSQTFRTVVDDFRIDQEGASALSFDRSGDRLYVVTSDSVAVIDADASSATFNTVIDTIDVGQNAESIAFPLGGPFGAGAYVVNQGDNTVSVVRLSDGTVIDTIEVGNDPSDVAFSPDGSVAYVVNLGETTTGSLSVIDVENHTVIDTVALGFAPVSVAVGPDGTVYAANAFGGTVLVIGIVAANPENV